MGLPSPVQGTTQADHAQEQMPYQMRFHRPRPAIMPTSVPEPVGRAGRKQAGCYSRGGPDTRVRGDPP